MSTPAAYSAAAMSRGLMDLAEGLGPLLEAVAGYRKQCEAAGFSSAISELMATQLHSHLLAKAFAP